MSGYVHAIPAKGRVYYYLRPPLRLDLGLSRTKLDAANAEEAERMASEIITAALAGNTGTPNPSFATPSIRSTAKKTKIAVERRRAHASAAGVYLLIRDNRVVYIGTSGDMAARVVTHRTNGRQFDRAYYIHAPGKDRFALERLLIAAIRPDQNTRGTSDVKLDPSPVTIGLV